MKTRLIASWVFLLPALASVASAQTYIATALAGGGVLPTPVGGAYAAITPGAMALDAQGNLYFVSANCVFKLDPAGTVMRVVGNSQIQGFSGDGGPAADAQLANPTALATDQAGNLYIADGNNGRVRRVASDGTITTVAGSGTATSFVEGSQAITAQLKEPAGVAVDTAGNLYISDLIAGRIRKVSPSSGVITTVAGSGSPTEGVDCSA
jgi:sugar lactone lactonase YvrE